MKKTHCWEDLMREKYTSEEIEAKRAKARLELLQVDLNELCESAGKTQVDLAELTKT
ncbi:MAG: hypothetical protein HY901_10505 [Deltaproteobacteria bacterium]|nr:hypothetical protein [Deltaproteobacteria bacterium]